MRYMLLVTDPAESAATPEFEAWEKALGERGITRRGARLRPEGATVRVRDGETLVTDGPYTGTAEPIGGFEIIECADLDEAIEAAATHPSAAGSAVEIRPFPEV